MNRAALRLVTPPTPDGDDDHALVTRIGDGDLGALGALYSRYAGALLQFADRAAPRDDAEDIVQVTFLRVLAIAGRTRPEGRSARPWLYAICTRVVFERRRALRRLARAIAAFGREPRGTETPHAGSRRDVTSALARLSDDKRITIVLAEIEGFTAPEIATIVSVPVGTVWTRLHHARRELRALLEDPR